MTNPMPQTVVDRIFAFMLTGKTGHIELHFRDGRLLKCSVNESIRIVADERERDDVAGVLDSRDSVAQDLGT